MMTSKFPVGAVPDEIFEAIKNIRRGPKNSERLAALDAEASAAIDRGEVKNEREAAKLFAPKYGNEGFDTEQRNNRLRDIANRIKEFRANTA